MQNALARVTTSRPRIDSPRRIKANQRDARAQVNLIDVAVDAIIIGRALFSRSFITPPLDGRPVPKAASSARVPFVAGWASFFPCRPLTVSAA